MIEDANKSQFNYAVAMFEKIGPRAKGLIKRLPFAQRAIRSLRKLQPVASSNPATSERQKIDRYLQENTKACVILGGHWSSNPGWLILDENDQDITKPLVFGDQTIDVIFTEHVFEHISFLEGISFLRESLRTLKEGGCSD